MLKSKFSRDVPAKSLSRLLKQKIDQKEIFRHSVSRVSQPEEARWCFVYYTAPPQRPMDLDWNAAVRIVRTAIRNAKQDRAAILEAERYKESDEIQTGTTGRRRGIPEHHVLWEDVATVAIAELRALLGPGRKAKANELLTRVRQTLAERFEIELFFLKNPESRKVSQTGTYSITVPDDKQRKKLRQLNKGLDWIEAKTKIKTEQESN